MWQRPALTIVILGFVSVASHAQAQNCGWLQRQYLAALNHSGAGSVADIRRQLRSAERQSQEGNCRPFLFFGPRPAPQCRSILARINRLKWQLQQRRYDQGPRQVDPAAIRDRMLANGCPLPGRQHQATAERRTICVRTCDGYYFPIESSASRSRLKTDAEVCQSMYRKDGQAELFTYPLDGDVVEARSLDGDKKYGDQPYAFRYRKSYSPSCATQLTEGIRALEKRYYAARQERAPEAIAASTVPLPLARPSVSADPETLANRRGHFSPAPPSRLASDAPVRVVGPAYYANLYNPIEPPRKSAEQSDPHEFHPPSFIGAAQAAETQTDSSQPGG